MELRPQFGPQEMFLASSADIAIFGGAAGAGKSYGLFLEPLRHALSIKGFEAVVFRRTLADAKKPGSTKDSMFAVYAGLGEPKNNAMDWKFEPGGKVSIGHLEHETTVLDWQGAQIALLLFDELTHFSRTMFFYMLSRNRSTCGVRPYVRATCNPDADSWVAEFISWWIDPVTGLPIHERAGKLRWFIRLNDKLLWGDSREEVIQKYGPDELPKSVTFIPATIHDNKILLSKDPGYLANLKALPTVDRERLLGGNWKIRPAAGLYFKREWCEFVDVAPANLEIVRYWDLAATEKREDNDPDWTVGVKLGRDKKTGLLYVLHVSRFREGPLVTRTNVLNSASADSKAVRIGLPQDPGQAGKVQAKDWTINLQGYNVSTRPERGDKIVRAGPFSAQAQAGNVKILKASWNDEFCSALEGFPDASHDDDMDAVAGAFSMFLDNETGLVDYYARLAAEAVAQKELSAA